MLMDAAVRSSRMHIGNLDTTLAHTCGQLQLAVGE
jgi:hypothetical protein